MNISYEILKLIASGETVKYYGHNEFNEFRINNLQFGFRSDEVYNLELSEVSFQATPQECTIKLKHVEGKSWSLVIESNIDKTYQLQIDTDGRYRFSDPPYLKPEIALPTLWDSFEERFF